MNRALKHRLEYDAFRLARTTSAIMPEAVAALLGSLLGAVVGSVLRIRRSDVDGHLRFVFPERSQAWRSRVARRCYRHFGREGFSFFRAAGWTRERLVERTRMVGFEDVLEATKDGGVLFLTGHLGSWEMSAAAVAARGLPLEVVAKRMANRHFGEALFGARERLGMRLIELEDARERGLQALQMGHHLLVAGDQNAFRSAFFVPFFGKVAATVKGPALFALRSGAPTFVMIALRDPGLRQRYTVTFSRLMFAPSGDEKRDIASFTEQYFQALEEAIRGAPEQYFWLHRRWKSRPPEELK